ncbi:zinc finger protein 608 [Phycodurus eques]|uniref:zinc finger protein 608 n=1 Tax=Phycodurus eques TaxID=693459 RepID=UPI002ACE523D|nr:zinc finger protein 608 [Phycodurus eques]
MFTPPGRAPALGQAGANGPSLPSSATSFPNPVAPPTCNTVRTRSVGTNTQEVALPSTHNSDADFLGPCQPGTSVNLEGIVWHETQGGVLVVNVTWRKRTYVGTLLDCTKLDWAPPRFCESPSSDPEMPGGRGRGKRLRLALADQPCGAPTPPVKVRGLPQHRSRGGGMVALPVHSKSRRGSLKLLSNCRAPTPFFTTEETKTTNRAPVLPSGKRKNKPPTDLDLSLVSSEDIKNGNGKRIRAKSRSAPSTPQGKSDPSFLDPGGGCTSSPLPILIDCPHPNCTKRYKHINGLRYHQTHAHLEVEEQRNPESEERLSDCEDTVYDLMESTNNGTTANTSAKKAAPLYKVTSVGSPKNRRLLLSTKTRRSSLLKDGLMDDLSNLPIISNMTVVLENCMVPDRSATVEMPKLEAEGLIDKKILCDKTKKANGKVDKLSKSRTNRLIAPAPPPPKLIAIPNAPYPTDSGVSEQSSPVPAVGLSSKNSSLKPIKPKLSIVVEPSLVKATLLTCKDTRKKEKRRLKDKHNRDTSGLTANGDPIKMEDSASKVAAKEIPGSLLKEHLSKQDVTNGLNETQESRMASIRAEADKVYTFTDNAPSPSIGSSSRLDAPSSCLVIGDSKDNSPAYSDISDAGDDGMSSENRLDGIRSRSGPSVSSGVNSNSNHHNARKTPPTVPDPTSIKEPLSPYYHSFEPYFLPGYVQADRQNTYHKTSSHDSKCKDRKDDAKDDDKGSIHDFVECKKGDGQPPPSQLQLAMSQTQTALAQSLYYGQYSRGLYMDHKLLLASCEQKQRAERGLAGRDGNVRHTSGAKVPEVAKGCCPKAILSYLEERGERGLGLKVDQHRISTKDCEDIKSPSSSSSSSSSSSHHNPNTQTDLDSNIPYSSPPDGPTWPHRLAHSKFSELESPLGEAADEGDMERSKEWGSTTEPAGPKATSAGGGITRDAKKVHGPHNLPPPVDPDDSDGLEGLQEEPMGVLSGESQSARAAVSPPMTPQQPYIQYQHSSYPPYLAMCESGRVSYRGASPTLVHNYPGFHYPLYGKTAGREESETSEKGSPEADHEVDRSDRSHVALGRHLHTHHHTHLGLTYNLVAGQYDIYPGLSSRSLVSGPQVSGRTSAESEVKK